MTKFERWFKDQFGRLPLTPWDHTALHDKHNSLQSQLAQVVSDLVEANRLDHQWTAALYAKQKFGKKP